jgi:drug/metabolite transporter (DMT)-like permease
MYLLAAFLFALNGVMAKPVIELGLSAIRLTEIRNAGSLIALAVWLLLTRPSAFRLKKSELPFLLAYGVLAFTVVQSLYFVTISFLPVGIGTLLIFLAPVFVAVWLKFFSQKSVSNRIWLALVLVMAGLALIAQVWQGLTLNAAGVASALICAVALAAFWLLGASGQEKRDAVSLTMWGFFFATLTWSVIAPWWSFPRGLLGESLPPLVDGAPGFPVWVLIAWNVLLGTIAPFLLVLGSLHRLGAERAGIVGTSEPLWAALLGALLLGELLTGVQIVGFFVVLAGIAVAEFARRPRPA